MKRILTSLTIAFTLLMTMSAKAQVKSYFGFFGGVSIPQGDFKSVDYGNNKSGFAKKGLTYGLDGAYYFSKNFGIGASITYQDNGELNQNEADSLASGYTKSYGADQSTVTAQKRYQTVNILFGPQYTFTYGKFLFDLRPSVGIIKVFSTPESNVLLSGITDQTGVFYQNGASSTVFAYGGNLSLRYKLSDNVFLTLRGAYLNSAGPSITNTDRTNEIGRYVTKQPITTINTTIGLSFGL
jgi:hypothetical protein